jgi:hypothetical protein
MINFISNRKKAGILAAAIGISAIASGCSSTREPLPTSTTSIEQPSNTNNQADTIEVDGEKYLIDFNEEDYVDKYSINNDIQALSVDNSAEGRVFWLDVDLLREEIAYADAIAEAYDNGTCPEEIKEEAKILYFIKNYYKDAPEGQWAMFIANLNSYYNLMALKNGKEEDYTFSEIDCYSLYESIVKGLLKVEATDPVFYDLCKLIHESCCDEKHTQLENGYSYCAGLDEFMDYEKENGMTAATTLRLTK